MTAVYGFRVKKTYRNQPPLGIGYIAALLREHGIAVSLIDAEARGWDIPTTVAAIAAEKPDIVGITSISMEAPSAYALARELETRVDALLVLGGPHASAWHEEIPAQCPELDVVVAGEGEHTMLDICRVVAAGESLEGIPGLRCHKDDGTWTDLIERAPVPNIDDLPPPAYDLYEHSLYRPLPHRQKRLPSTCMITSRGCSFGKCIYCEMSAMVRRNYRRHSPKRVVSEMTDLIRLTGARDIYFQDDIFITDKEWMEEFCDRIEAASFDVIWSCESRFNGVSESLFRRMHRAGCWRIYFGIESGDQKLLDRMCKGFTVQEARDAVARARRAGLEVVGFFMLGLPGATRECEEATVRLALDMGLEHAMFSLTVPHANTALYRVCEQHGTIFSDHEFNLKRAAYIPDGYGSREELEAFQGEAYRRFYLRPRYFLERLAAIRSLSDIAYLARGVLALPRFLH